MLTTGTLPAAAVLKIGSEIDVYVTHIDSSHQFAVHDVSLSHLIGMINLWGRQLETVGKQQLSVDSIAVGLSYLVKNPIDDQWCRGTLNAIDDERKIVRVYSVDFGDMLELPFADIGSKLMLLGNRLGAFPPLAVLCVWDSDGAREMGAELKKCLYPKTIVKMQILSSIDNGGYRVEVLDLEKPEPDSQEEKDVSFTSQECSSLSPVHEENSAKLENGNVTPADTVDGNIEVEPKPPMEEKINERVQAPLYRAPPRREPNPLNETNKPSTEDKTVEVFKKLVQEANRDKTVTATIPEESVKATENELTSTNGSGTSVTASVNGINGAAGRIENEERMNKLAVIKEVLEADAAERETPKTCELSTELVKDQVINPPTAPTFDKDLLKKALVQLFNDEEFLDAMVGKLSASFGK